MRDRTERIRQIKELLVVASSLGRRHLCLLCLLLFAVTVHAQKPVSLAFTMPMNMYVSLGPIHDSAKPSLAFPVIDVFSPAGQLIHHAYSVQDVQHFLKSRLSAQSRPIPFPTDTLADVAIRYPDLHLQADKLRGRYTLLFVSAPGCHACELQEYPLHKAHLLAMGINQVYLTLGLQ